MDVAACGKNIFPQKDLKSLQMFSFFCNSLLPYTEITVLGFIKSLTWVLIRCSFITGYLIDNFASKRLPLSWHQNVG